MYYTIHFYDILEKAKFQGQRTDQCFLVGGVAGGVGKGTDFFEVMELFCVLIVVVVTEL